MTAVPQPSARCRTLLLQLSRYLDGELTARQRRTVEQHVKTCQCCSEMSARLRRTIAACRAELTARPPKAVMSRAARRVKNLIG